MREYRVLWRHGNPAMYTNKGVRTMEKQITNAILLIGGEAVIVAATGIIVFVMIIRGYGL